jgi:outer membrane protein assembly factor BamB
VVDGIVYVAMNDRRIFAIDAATGKLIWTNDFGNKYDGEKEAAQYPWLQGPRAKIHALNYYREFGWLIPSSLGQCNLHAIDAKTGKDVWKLTTEQVCGTNEEFGDPAKGIIGSLGNQGFISRSVSHPPAFLGKIMFHPVAGASGAGGRSFVTAFDMSDPQNPKRLYREFITPPAQGVPNWAVDQCNRVNGNGWYFEYPRFLEGINYPARDRDPTYLATKCTDVDPEVVKNDWMDLVPGSKTFGKIHTASATSPVWGHYPIDPESGIVYVGWGDQGPYPNATHRYGPALMGSGFTAHDVRTGKMVWWFAANPHDLWDYDCSWGGIIGQVQGKKAYIKGCKNGIVYALDVATGKPFWVYDAPTSIRGGNSIQTYYGVGKNNNPKDPEACCRLTKEHMGKPWMNYPSKGPFVQNCYTTCLESDIAYDGKRVYAATFNDMAPTAVGNYRDFGNNGGPGGPQTNFPGIQFIRNMNINAIDVNTGKTAWTYRIEGAAYRGGLSVTGGMVMAYDSLGSLKFVDAETGKLLHSISYGVPVSVMPTVGATKDGKMLLFDHIGGGGGSLFSSTTTAGTLIALGLPDKLPQPQVITKEVIKEVPREVVKEVIKEVPKEVIKEVVKEVPKEVVKEVIKEVVKEVPKEVTVETISPISYAAIGIGVVLVVISGVLFSRRKKT